MNGKTYQRLVAVVRLLMGAALLVSGLNWWFKLITPYPSISDFANAAPPPDLVGALIKTANMFHLVKATELLAGIALLTNRFVPLMLVAVFPVTLSIFIVDVFVIASPRGLAMGIGSLLINSFLLLAYLDHYRPMLRSNSAPDSLATNRDWRMPIFGVLALIAAVTMVCILATLIVSYVHNPQPLPRH
jgi:uncharacterized membrane protein YphA (DoxX/SURF4 family)